MTHPNHAATEPVPGGITFLSTFGRLPGTWLALAVIVLAGLSEGFGIALFIPVIELMAGGTEGPFLAVLHKVFAVVGLEVRLATTVGLITVFVVGAFALNYLRGRVLIVAKYRCISNMRRDLFESLFGASWGYLSSQAHGEVVNLLMTESMRYGQTLQYQAQVIGASALIAVYAGISAALSWHLLLVTATFGGAFAMAVRPLVCRAKIIGERTTVANRDFNFHTVDFLRGAKLIKVTAAEGSAIEKFSINNLKLFRVSFDTEHINELTHFFLQAAPAAILAAIVVFAHEVLMLAPSFILVFLVIMARMMPRFAQLQQDYHQYVLRRPAVPLIDDVLARSRAVQEDTGQGRVSFTSLRQGIEFDDVTFRYNSDSAPALDRVSLDIGRNRTVALVGGSGSGKSTLVDVLAGLRRPDSGAVRIDGVDLTEMDVASWRRRIGYVTQETAVFNDSVRNNLLFAHPEATDDDIARCLEIAHLSATISALPRGLDTVLGEGGVILSGGERQRLALARALIGRPDLLLLDEATSALDNDSERVVQRAIDEIASEMTLFVVAHRLSTVRNADTIHVIEHGRIIESGKYGDLVDLGGRFAELHQLQFG